MPDFDPLVCHYCGAMFPTGTQRMLHEERFHEDGGGSEKDAMFQTGEPMDIAWLLLKAKEDAPNYRCPADDPNERCGNCKHWVKKSEDIGRCKLFDFQCNAKCTCDAWSGEK